MDFEISAGQVKAMLKRGEKFTLLDVREPWEWEMSRIEGSKQMPMGDVPTRAHEELDSDELIVVVCHHGVLIGIEFVMRARRDIAHGRLLAALDTRVIPLP